MATCKHTEICPMYQQTKVHIDKPSCIPEKCELNFLYERAEYIQIQIHEEIVTLQGELERRAGSHIIPSQEPREKFTRGMEK